MKTSSRLASRSASSVTSIRSACRPLITAGRAWASSTGTDSRPGSSSVLTGARPTAAATIPVTRVRSAGSAGRTSRVCWPILAFSSAAVPVAITRPWSMTAIWLASRSASSRYCVVSSTVVPSATSALIIAHTSPRLRGSRPVVGSSRNRTAGRWTRLAARSRPASHATGVGLDRTTGGVCQAEPLEQLPRSPLRLRPGHLEQPPDQQQVLKTGQVLVDRRVLAGQPDQFTDPVGVGDDVRAADPGVTGIGPQQRGQHPDHGGLPRPVRPQQAQHHARPDSQIDAIHRQRLPEPLDQAHRLNRERHGRTALASAAPSSPPRRPAGCSSVHRKDGGDLGRLLGDVGYRPVARHGRCHRPGMAQLPSGPPGQAAEIAGYRHRHHDAERRTDRGADVRAQRPRRRDRRPRGARRQRTPACRHCQRPGRHRAR